MTMPMDTPPTAPRSRASAANVVALLLATCLLAGSVAVGYWLLDSAPVPPQTPSAEVLTNQAQHIIYGGDAYTGIQNAAADTENSVVAGANSITDLASSLQASRLEADAAWWGHLTKGLAALIIAVAAGNFITVVQRFGVGGRRLT